MSIDPIIITGGTENYAKNINVLLSSLEHNNPKLNCIVYCFNWDELLINKFRNIYDVNFIKVVCKDELDLDVKNNTRSPEALKIKIQCIFDTYLYAEDHSGILWIDADSVITRDLTPMLNILSSGKYDVLCTRRKHRKAPHLIFALGVFGLSRTQNATRFIIKLCDNVKNSEGVGNWFHDQLEFYNAFISINPNIYPLTKYEHSLKGFLDSMIYSRRETIDQSPKDVAKYHKIPIKQISNLPDSIYPA